MKEGKQGKKSQRKAKQNEKSKKQKRYTGEKDEGGEGKLRYGGRCRGVEIRGIYLLISGFLLATGSAVVQNQSLTGWISWENIYACVRRENANLRVVQTEIVGRIE
ncbi:uncharacterized protein RAG0_01294 [Rhynchosporium agropyri]|uniref:Uncharacterized protein n=1 Tax=Rhynchosporium agropyri TaxID=914238 RepID=A0A1E1JWA8_9HELO|nr:uncharacterized protein RAG0_01294 [Rhynchosporium agropyri]